MLRRVSTTYGRGEPCSALGKPPGLAQLLISALPRFSEVMDSLSQLSALLLILSPSCA
jgi:hypothetical protein